MNSNHHVPIMSEGTKQDRPTDSFLSHWEIHRKRESQMRKRSIPRWQNEEGSHKQHGIFLALCPLLLYFKYQLGSFSSS